MSVLGGHWEGDVLREFEGLVATTARMYAAQLRREEEDLSQELWIVVDRAIKAYRNGSPLPLRRFVFGSITNKIKDYKRDAAREMARRERYGVSFVYIEETRTLENSGAAERFDALYHHATRDEVYGGVDDRFELPSTVSKLEAGVLTLLMMNVSKAQIVVRLGIGRAEVEAALAALRIKLRDWAPAVTKELEPARNGRATVTQPRATVVAAGSRAA